MQATQSDTHAVLDQLQRTEGYLQSDPENRHLQVAVIDLALAAGAVERASQHVKSALGKHPDDAFLRFRLAQVLIAQRRWDEAREVLAPLHAAHQDLNIAFSLADCLFQLARYEEIVGVLGPYRHRPDLPAEVAIVLLRALHHLGEFAQGEELIDMHAERFTAVPAFQGAASLLLLDNGKLEKASACSARALQDPSRPVEAVVASASIALAQLDTDLAIDAFNEVLAKHPKEGRSWSGLGIASLLRHDLGGAGIQLTQALKYMPEHIGTWHALGWSKLLSGDLAEAKQIFDRALQLDRNFGESHGAVAVVAAQEGRRGEAEAAIERALRLDGDSLSAHYARMVLAGQHSDPEKFKQIALRLLRGRMTPFGKSLASVVEEHGA